MFWAAILFLDIVSIERLAAILTCFLNLFLLFLSLYVFSQALLWLSHGFLLFLFPRFSALVVSYVPCDSIRLNSPSKTGICTNARISEK
ncbi:MULTISPECIES: hypothetical protein [Methanosarcina]|uniref:Uncharacterized protein n=1 Tax=Methanosarcina mazei TaxID=2209 RepID=A0A0F8K6U5_METMZ|nr:MULTISPECIES: hypothetical protein [Methanosarcina]KKG02993.1 hypothetical protein DU40_04650 [Methanosarcina mazei]KKG30453.1 hypothetical protein DU52_08090 [Methanosarcina mazei]KKG69413.1 hypothetical protein DU63_10775 [Methanosarcina mazei]KKG83563.1 hypothetical protein DU55_11455 [Methanosarcina mazei]KKG91391.1 hypothetical protein DU69_01390 [Methanosarcina mazei]